MKGWTALKTEVNKVEGKAGGLFKGSPRQSLDVQTVSVSIPPSPRCQADDEIVIIMDTREPQQAWNMYFSAPCQRGTLKTGDYSLRGYTDLIALERKEKNDLIGCLSSGRSRFEAELERGQEFEYFAVIVEATWPEILQGQYRSKLHPNAANGSICAWEVRYKIPFFFCVNQQMSAHKCESLLRKFYKEKLKKFDEQIPF